MTGEVFTDTISSTPVHFSSISFRTCGSIFAAFRTTTCATKESIISRTAGALLTFRCSFNPTFSGTSGNGWISKGYYGLDQGPIVLMIENYRSGFLWRLMRSCPYIVTGLRCAGFSGGWLQLVKQK